MTTLNGLPDAAPQTTGPIAPTLADVAKSEPLVAAVAAETRPTEAPEILPLLVERPAWPRIFPGL